MRAKTVSLALVLAFAAASSAKKYIIFNNPQQQMQQQQQMRNPHQQSQQMFTPSRQRLTPQEFGRNGYKQQQPQRRRNFQASFDPFATPSSEYSGNYNNFKGFTKLRGQNSGFMDKSQRFDSNFDESKYFYDQIGEKMRPKQTFADTFSHNFDKKQKNEEKFNKLFERMAEKIFSSVKYSSPEPKVNGDMTVAELLRQAESLATNKAKFEKRLEILENMFAARDGDGHGHHGHHGHHGASNGLHRIHHGVHHGVRHGIHHGIRHGIHGEEPEADSSSESEESADASSSQEGEEAAAGEAAADAPAANIQRLATSTALQRQTEYIRHYPHVTSLDLSGPGAFFGLSALAAFLFL